MRFNNYQESMDVLRNRPVRPEFAKIRATLLDQSAQGSITPVTFPLPLMLSMVCFLALSVFAHVNHANIQAKQSIEHAPVIATPNAPEQTGTQFRTVERFAAVKQGAHLFSPSNERSSNVPSTQPMKEQVALNEVQNSPLNQVPVLMTLSQIEITTMRESNTKDTHIRLHDELLTDRATLAGSENTYHSFSVYGSGKLLAAPSTAVFSLADKMMNGSIGMRYAINPSSSFVVEIGGSRFVTTSQNRTTILTDTTFSHGGVDLRNTIGNVVNVTSTSTKMIYSLALGYQFSFLQSAYFAPFAGVTVGISPNGGVGSERLGLRYANASPVSFGVALRADNWLPSLSAVQTIFGFEATAEYAW
jgi:hypothetical protein